MGLSDIRYGLAQTIANHFAGGTLPVSVYPHLIGNPSTPAVVVNPENLLLKESFDNANSLAFRVWTLANGNDWEQGSMTVDLLIEGVVAAVRADPMLPLNGSPTCNDSEVFWGARMPADIQGPGILDWNGAALFGWGVVVRVLAEL